MIRLIFTPCLLRAADAALVSYYYLEEAEPA